MKKTPKAIKPKKGSKVLCISEHLDWKKNAKINPQIGWVYWVERTEVFRKGTPDEFLGLVLLGQGEQENNCVFAYRSDFFQVVGKAKIVRPRNF